MFNARRRLLATFYYFQMPKMGFECQSDCLLWCGGGVDFDSILAQQAHNYCLWVILAADQIA